MMNPIFSLTVYIVELVISSIFLSEIFEYRLALGKRLLIGGILTSVGSAINILFLNNGTINGIATFAIIILFTVLCYQSSLLQSIFHAAILVIISMAAEISVIYFASAITGNDFLEYKNNFLLSIFEAATSKMLFFLIALVLVRVLHPKNDSGKIPIHFLLYPLSVTICQGIFWRICSQPATSQQTQHLLSIASSCLFASAILLFITYSHHAKKDSEAMQMKSELSRLQTEKSYYEILDQQNQQLMIYVHDAKKHLAAIQALNDDPQIGNYVTALSQQLADYSRNCHSGNKLLDVIIHKYVVDCKMRGIQFEYDVKVCNLSQLEDIDLVAILGNLMDNAIAAAEGSTEKTVSLNTVHRNSYSVIILANSCDTPPKQSGNRLLSTKSDTQAHGFGLKSVKKTIQKYQGDYEWNYDVDAKQFTMTVMIVDREITRYR